LVQNNSTIENVSVENNTFNSATSKDNYYPFISICLESIGSNVSGVKSLTIKNNKFLSNKVDSSYRAVVSIYSVGNGIKQSTIMNSEISGNVCNSNQSIIVTDNSSTKKLPLFSSNFAIKNNTCGTIGILAGTSPENASGSIDVRGNTVKLISNLDYTATSKMIYGDGYLPTCFMSIQDNIVNWIDIQTNNSNSNKETCIISKNKIFAGNPQVLSNIATNISNIALSYKASNASANTSLSIISDNSIYSENSYTYNTAIYCEGYANIIGNSISGCVKNSSNTNYPIVQIASGSVLFTNNTINRSGLEVDCFIKGPGTSSALKSKIINNVLIGADSTYTTNKDTPSSSPNIWYDTNFSW
jgi:hypothetical protein